MTKKKAVKKSTKKTSSKKKVSKKVNKKLVTHVAIILDKSGSMNGIKSKVIEMFNKQIEKIAAESVDMETYVSLITFNNGVDVDFFNADTSNLKPITLRTYVPNGGTAMLDAVGSTIDKMEKEIDGIEDKETAVLFIIISDGMENASLKYDRKDVAKRIARLEQTERWTFTYLGANQDLKQISDDLNIPIGNTSSFVADAQGVMVASGLSQDSASSYFTSRRLGNTNVKDYYTTSKKK